MTKTLMLLPIAALVLACGDDVPEEVEPEDMVACLPADVVTALERHALDLAATAELLAGHPSANEVTGFLLAPALPFPPALSAAFAGPLVMECSEPLVYDAFCEEGRCSRIECTGQGASWVNHLWIEDPVSSGRWYYQAADVYLYWAEGEPGTSFSITTDANGPGAVDVSMLATGTMDEQGLTLDAKFPALHAAGPTTLAYLDDASGYRGALSIDDVVVAEVDASARLVPTGDCP